MTPDSVERMVLVEKIRKALKENTEKEATIQQVLGTRTFSERQDIVKSYKETHRENIRDSFVGMFPSNYERLVYRLCLTRVESASFWIRDAAKSLRTIAQGWFCTDERALVGLLITYTADELGQLHKTYQQLFENRRPQDDVASATSSDFKILLQELWKKKDVPEPDDAEGVAIGLYSALVGQATADLSKVCTLLTSGPRSYLQQVLTEYAKQGKEEEELSVVLERETSGWLKTGLLMLIEWIKNPSNFFAKELDHALFGWFSVNHAALRNYLIDRSETDLSEIVSHYEKTYSRSLVDAIRSKLDGHYADLLVAFIERHQKKTDTPAE